MNSNRKPLCTGTLPYVAPVSEAVDLAAASLLCASGEQQDFSNTITDLGSQDYGNF